MAEIKFKPRGAGPVAVLADGENLLLKSAVKDYLSRKNATVAQLAEEIGITRAQLYSILDSKEIDLERFSTLQQVLEIWLIYETEVDKCIKDTERKFHHPSNVMQRVQDKLDYYEYLIVDESYKVSAKSLYVFWFLELISPRPWAWYKGLLISEIRIEGRGNKEEDFSDELVEKAEQSIDTYRDLKKQNLKNYNEWYLQNLVSRSAELAVYSISVPEAFSREFATRGDEIAAPTLIDLQPYPGAMEKFFWHLDRKQEFKSMEEDAISLDIPILGNTEFWESYDKKITRDSNYYDRPDLFEEYHHKFMQDVYAITRKYDKDMHKISAYCKKNKRFLRYTPLHAKDSHDTLISIHEKTFQLFYNKDEKIKENLKRLLDENKWMYELDVPDKRGKRNNHIEMVVTTLDKKTACIAFNETSFVHKNTVVAMSTLRDLPLNEQEQGPRYDFAVVISRKGFHPTAIKKAKEENVILLEEHNLENLITLLS